MALELWRVQSPPTCGCECMALSHTLQVVPSPEKSRYNFLSSTLSTIRFPRTRRTILFLIIISSHIDCKQQWVSFSLSLSHTNSLIESNWIDLLLLSKEFICTNKAYQSLLETQPEAHVRPFLLRHQWNGQNVLKSLSAVNPSLITMYAFNMNNMHKTLFACRISKAEQHCHCSPWRCLVVLLFHSPHTVIQ